MCETDITISNYLTQAHQKQQKFNDRKRRNSVLLQSLYFALHYRQTSDYPNTD